MKRIYATLAVLGAFAMTASAQKDLSLTPLQPVNNQAYNNFNNGDTMVVAAVLTNLGPDNLAAGDSVTVEFPLDWLITPQGYVFRDTYGASELNSRTVGGKDTVAFAFIQGASLGSTPDGPAVVKIPSNKIENEIKFQAYGFRIDGTSKVIFDDPGADVDNNSVVMDGNNVANPTGVKFGNPTSISDLFASKNKEALSTYPNPTTGVVNFKYSFGNGSEATVRISDVTGRVVFTKEFGKQFGDKQLSVNVSALTEGVYYMELITDKKSAFSKLTIRK